MAVADRQGLPVAICVESATPHEVKLATNTLVQMVIPTFLGIPAREWLKQHENDLRVEMEDQFFLPALYERLRNEFGSRVVKKPERFGGETDILFDDTAP